MITSDGAHYLVSRRLVHAVLLLMAALVVVPLAVGWLYAPRWLPRLTELLDQAAPLSDPDVVIVRSNGRSQVGDTMAAELLDDGANAVVLLGRPFTPDLLDPPQRSRRFDRLVAAGAAPERIVELYDGEDVWEEMASFREAAAARGWNRALFIVQTGATRYHLIAAQRVLGPAGIAVGQVVLPDEDPPPLPWWQDNQLRGHVIYNVVLVLFALLLGRG